MRILLADDRAEIRSGLRLLLEEEPDVVVVGEVAEPAGLLGQVQSASPDLVLLDWELPSPRISELVAALRSLRPGLRIIALSGRPEARKTALAAGVDAFVSKGDQPELLLAAIRKAMAG
ncbi:MAG: response regulator transcription factor [Bacteroidota bacterium]